MLLRQIAIAIAALVAWTVVPGAQGRPDFTGTWTRTDSTPERTSVAAVGDAAFRVGALGSGWGSPLTVRQEAGRLTIAYPFFSTYDLQPPITLSFALDGSESRNTLMIGHATAVLRSRASWRGDTLMISTAWPAPSGVSGPVEVRQALTLESPATLSIETSRTHAGGSAPLVTRTTWSRR
jgi:hypothetical protein